MLDKAYRVVMKLNIRAINPSDYGVYMCVAKNALGVTDGSIKVYSKCFTKLVWFCSISLVVVVLNTVLLVVLYRFKISAIFQQPYHKQKIPLKIYIINVFGMLAYLLCSSTKTSSTSNHSSSLYYLDQ